MHSRVHPLRLGDVEPNATDHARAGKTHLRLRWEEVSGAAMRTAGDRRHGGPRALPGPAPFTGLRCHAGAWHKRGLLSPHHPRDCPRTRLQVAGELRSIQCQSR